MQKGASYEITADGETQTLDWPLIAEEASSDGSCLDLLGGSCTYEYYPSTVTVDLLARGFRESAELNRIAARVQALLGQGYLDVGDIVRMRDIPRDRVMQIAKRDDFPAPARVVSGIKTLWLFKELRAWWCRDGQHVPGSCAV